MTSPAALDKGQTVNVRMNPGDGGTSRGIITSVLNNTENKNALMPGGSDMPGVNQNLSKYKGQKRAIKII